MKNKKWALLSVFLAAFLGAAVIPMVKIDLGTIPPLTFTFIRFFISSLVLLPILIERKIKIKNIQEVILPVTLSSINIILFIFAIRLTSANVGQMIYVMVPIIVTVLSYFILKEKITFYKISGVVLGIVGAAILLSAKTVLGYSLKNNLIGGSMILLGALFFSLYLIFSKRLQKKYPPIYITTVFTVVTAVISLIMSIGEIKLYQTWFSHLSLMSGIFIIYVAVFGTSFYYLLQQYAIEYGSATLGSIINFIQPVFTIFWAGLLLGEKITPDFLIAAVFILIGAYLTSR